MVKELKGIREVYTVKKSGNVDDGIRRYTQIKKKNLNKEKAKRKDNFLIIDIGKNNYIVVGGTRIYLNKFNSIIMHHSAIVDVDELQDTPYYYFDNKYLTSDLFIISDFDDLRGIAKQQFNFRGHLPQISLSKENGKNYIDDLSD